MSRRPTLLLGLAGFTSLLFLIGIAVGSSFMPFDRVLSAIMGNGSRADGIIVWNLRAPRVVLAALAGACLAVAGVLLQRATRNPLAAPSVLGIVDGAAVGVLAFFVLFSNEANALVVSIYWQPLAALLGALIFAGIVTTLYLNDQASPMRLIFYGVALAALANAFVVLTIIAGPVYRASQALIWLAGSVHEAEWRDAYILGAVCLVAAPLLAWMRRDLDQMRLDDQSGVATGLAVNRARFAAFALSVLLTAATVSVVGGIGFVGLIAPHLARLAFGSGAAMQMTGAALFGAMIVLAADVFARLAFQPLEVPTGAITALIGAPYFIYILIRQGRAHA